MAKKKKESRFSKFLSKFLVFIIIVLSFLIAFKKNTELKDYIYKKVFESNIGFVKINEIYKKYFGSSVPLKDNTKTQLVSAEKLEYESIEDYKEGAKLIVKDNYLIPSLDSGLVIFVGDKEDFGKTIIIQRPDNIEVWYSNLENTNVKLYDYVKKGSNLGQVKEKTLYISFYKDGKSIDYKKYI